MTNKFYYIDEQGAVSTIDANELKSIAVNCWAKGSLDVATMTVDNAEQIIRNSDDTEAQNVCFELEDALALRELRNNGADTIVLIDGEIHTLEINRIDGDSNRTNLTDEYLGNSGDWKRIDAFDAWQADEPSDTDTFCDWLRDVCAIEDSCEVYFDGEQIK